MQELLHEATFRSNKGQTLRKVCFFGATREYVVIEHELITQDIGPKKWVTNTLFQHANRDICRQFYMGVVSKVAHEEGNTLDAAVEEREKLLFKSVSSHLGKE